MAILSWMGEHPFLTVIVLLIVADLVVKLVRG
jgi:hypothetical protein